MRYYIYKIQYKEFVYYGLTKRLLERKRKHIKQVFDLIHSIRRNDLKSLRTKSLYEIGNIISKDYRWSSFVLLKQIESIINFTIVAETDNIENANKLENILINCTENINKHSHVYKPITK